MGSGRRAFSALARLPDDELDLARTAMLIAVAEYPLLDVDGELAAFDSLGSAAFSVGWGLSASLFTL